MLSLRSPVCRTLFCVATMILASPAYADDMTVYESLESVEIGAVFFSPQDRTRLDRKRRNKARSNSRSGRKDVATGRRVNSRAAGYIIGRAGKEKIYIRGDFVDANVPSTMNFPGDVKITKTTLNPKAPTSRSATAGESEETRSDLSDEKE